MQVLQDEKAHYEMITEPFSTALLTLIQSHAQVNHGMTANPLHNHLRHDLTTQIGCRQYA